MLVSDTPLLEIVVRVVVIYTALLVFIRVAGKRELGQLGPLDLLAMLLLAETVAPALTGQDTSIVAALLASATLLALTASVSWLTFRFRRLERWVEGEPVILVENGRVQEENARREKITRQELDSALRRSGLDRLEDVRLAVAEPKGQITVVPRR